MGLFGKKKRENTECVFECSEKETNEIKSKSSENIRIGSVKVLGVGCKSCHDLFENAKEAVETVGLNIEVDYITDMTKIMEYGVMRMPALVIDEKVASMGKVLKVADIEKLIRKYSD